ncbi:MAG: S8/S53 family peptidase, partial [Acidobacteriota bacterium]
MLISLVNRTNGQILDAELQRVIRAVNRQIEEDVRPYWSRSATLRLEGALDDGPDPENPRNLRGQAIIYVCECVDQENYLGYHNLNQSGIPFGFVFLDLCDKLKEEWSVTLSHEALELLMDPEVNLLVKGPHPQDPNREVFHWYELCDAVQRERYQIDGVWVCNFLLPLYFTGSEEEGGRNDFLSTCNPDGSHLPSFGVNPGGYIGFYDPLLQGHSTYCPPGDSAADKRLEIKWTAKLTRRALRYQRPHLPGGRIEGAATAAVPNCECIVIEVAAADNQFESTAQGIAREVLGEDWKVQAFGPEEHHQFELVPSQPVPAGQAWDFTYQLRESSGVATAEPLFEFSLAPWIEARGAASAVRAAGVFGGILPEAEQDRDWSLKQARVPEAWQLFEEGQEKGGGVVVGHPDTGYQTHPDIWQKGSSNRIDISRDRDLVDDDDDALDPVEGIPPFAFPGHGTGTSSVILGTQRGAAPAAHLVPVRVSPTVALLSTRNLGLAIYHAVDAGCHLISISMGGLHSGVLRQSVQYAEQNGVIVLAAAGNYVPFVVWPAAYEEVIALGATNVRKAPWVWSSRGSSVDISGPGESVWHAEVTRDGTNFEFDFSHGSGTSYAVATTAGIAALWLSFHGRGNLINKYGLPNLTRVFRHILKSTAQVPLNWKTQQMGAGIVNAEAVLQMELPDRVPDARTAKPSILEEIATGFENFRNLFQGLGRGSLRRGLGATLGIASDD